VSQSKFLTFEHPLSERLRLFLRTEDLFQLTKYRFNHLENEWDAKDCLATVIELYDLLERTEIRTELLKEIERSINTLQRLSETPTINYQALSKILNELESISETIKNYSTKQGLFPKENELLNSLRQRVMIAGGTCSFDAPSLHYWLSLPVKNRQYLLSLWISVFEPLERSLTLVLDLLRQSNFPTKEIATNGSFQKSLNSQTPCQLLRIVLPSTLGVFPEISASKHRINIRYLQPDYESGKTKPSECDIPFELTCCMI